MKVTMVGGPKDGQSYDYSPHLPNVLVFQHFDANMAVHVDNYRRIPHTHRYLYMES
jgi:hypothetical protein